MKCTIPEISWHNRDPVLSVDVQPTKANDIHYRLASGGTDSHVLIWLMTVDKAGVTELECAADLTRHTKPVNCVRFSPSGEFLASGDDEACIIIWKMKTGSDPSEFPTGDEENFKEQWISVKVLRGHLQDVYDVSWSADSKNLISGSVDNTAIMWDVSTGKNLAILSEHKGFVQGVAWDPCGQYVATLSSDRVCRVYSAAARRVVCRMRKGVLPGTGGGEGETKPTHLFHDDTLKSFFRRLSFSPDGELLIVPSALVEQPGKTTANATILFSRHCLNKPLAYLPSLSQYTVAVRCCPVLFALRPMSDSAPLLPLPYRVVVAVATQCSVVLYDTQHAAPFAFITNIHYTRLTDLTWSSDGRILVVSSTDGYCSVITFAQNELGTVYTPEKSEEKNNASTTVNNEESKGDTKEIKKADEAVLPPSEDANMPMELSSDEIKKLSSTSKENTSVKNTSQGSSVVDKDAIKESQESPMEVDDFHLVYETTVSEPVLETKPVTEPVSETKPEAKPEILTECNEARLEDVLKCSMDVDESKEVEKGCEESNENKESAKNQEKAHVEEEKPCTIESNDSSKTVKCHETEDESSSKNEGQTDLVTSDKEKESLKDSESSCNKKTSGEGSVEVEDSRQETESQNAATSSHKAGDAELESKTVLPMVSPMRPAEGTMRPEMTSPQPNRAATTPGNSNKKTPRRVQLITLSSPKSKKKLLQ